MVMGVYESLDKLVEVILKFGFGDSFSFFYHFVEGVVGANFQDDVDILGILEDVVEEEDVFMFEGSMDFDLGDQLDGGRGTFCLALDFLRVYLLIILMACTFLVYRFSTS